jgi:hypothetical protein
MWGRRRKRGGRHPGTQLSRQLSLGLLEDAMARAEQQQEEAEPEPVPYPQAGHPAPAVPPARPGLQDQDVPVDNSADPDTETAGQDEPPQSHQGLPGQRTKDSTRDGSFGGKNPSLRPGICSPPSANYQLRGHTGDKDSGAQE